MFKVEWTDGNGQACNSEHASMEGAQKKARDMSKKFGTATMTSEGAAAKITYEAGKIVKAGSQETKTTQPQTKEKETTVAKSKADSISEQFGAREGSNLQSLVGIMSKNLNKYVPINELVKEVYGNQKAENKGPLMMVMKGIKVKIERDKLKFEVRKQREDKVNSFGLFAK